MEIIEADGCQRMSAVISAWDQDERGGRTDPKMATSDSIPKALRGEIIWTHRKREMMVSINSLKRRFNTLVNIPQTGGPTGPSCFEEGKVLLGSVRFTPVLGRNGFR